MKYQRSISRLLRGDDPVEAAQIRCVEGLRPDQPIPPDMKYRVQSAPSRVACRKCRTLFRASPIDEFEATETESDDA